MKTIILVQPKNNSLETTYAPLGLLSLAAYVRKDFDVRIVDLRFDPEDFLYGLIEETKPLAVGFSMLTGNCIKTIISLSKTIKERHPGIKTIAGGIHPTFFPELTLENPYLDFVAVNEGEKTLLALLKTLESGGDFSYIDNLGWKDENGRPRMNKTSDEFLDLNELPMPAWDLVDAERYIKNLSKNSGERVLDFYTSKGCPFPCSFCYNLNFNKRKWRARSAERAADELEFLHKRYGADYFIIHDDNFVVDRGRALKFAELIVKKGLKIKYSIDARVDYFDCEFLGKLKESGLFELRVGCESGSNRILADVVQKQITAEQTEKAVAVAKKLDLRVLLSFVIGWPTETTEERQATVRFILKLLALHPRAWVYPLWIYIPYPGTTLFAKAIELGFKAPRTLDDWGNYFWGRAHLPWIKNPEIYELIHELSPFAWYNRPFSSLPDKSPKAVLKFLFVKAFRPFILFRFKHDFWFFPLEARLALSLRNLLQKAAAH